MGQQQPPRDYDDQSGLDRTQPSPTRRARQLDWRPPDYQSGEDEPALNEAARPPVRRVPRPQASRRRPPTEGAPAWLVWALVGILVGVIVLLVVLFVVWRPAAEPEPTATIFVVTPTATLPPRPTATAQPEQTPTPEPTAEEQPGPTAAPPDVITIGGYVRVVAPAGVNFRQTAGTDGTPIQLLNVGTVLEVIGGPQEANDLTWWQLRNLDDGQEGWVAASVGEDVLLEPASAP